jgi:hypothetical protein
MRASSTLTLMIDIWPQLKRFDRRICDMFILVLSCVYTKRSVNAYHDSRIDNPEYISDMHLAFSFLARKYNFPSSLNALKLSNAVFSAHHFSQYTDPFDSILYVPNIFISCELYIFLNQKIPNVIIPLVFSYVHGTPCTYETPIHNITLSRLDKVILSCPQRNLTTVDIVDTYYERYNEMIPSICSYKLSCNVNRHNIINRGTYFSKPVLEAVVFVKSAITKTGVRI